MDKNISIDLYKIFYEYGFSYEDMIKIISDKSFFKYDDSRLGLIVTNNFNYLFDKGYNLDEIKKMALGYPGSLCVSDKKRKSIENIFLELGMTYTEFKKMVIYNGTVWGYSKKRICCYIDFFRELGYSNKDIVNVFKFTTLILRSSVDNLKKLYNDMIGYGFSSEEIFKIGKSFSGFWGHSFNKVICMINAFMSFGFNNVEAKSIVIKSPSLLGYSSDTALYKLNELLNIGFSKEKLIGVVNMYPGIINCDVDRTKIIFDFFNSIGLHDRMLEFPKLFFIQGIESSYARYCFYNDNNIEINNDTFRRLFVCWKYFESTYKIDRDGLLDKYRFVDSVCKKKIKELG